MGNLAIGRLYLEQALAIRQKKLGADHPDTAESLYHLGSLQRTMGDLSQARIYLRRALSIFEQSLGFNHQKAQMVREDLKELQKRIWYQQGLAESRR